MQRARAKMTITAVLAALLGASQARAQGSGADVARLQADVARLQQELREQKQLLLQVMQADQQRYDMLLQILRTMQSGGGAPPPSVLPALPGVPRAEASTDPAPSSAAAEKAARATAAVSGKVRLPPGAGDVYVFLEGVRGGSGRGRSLEIKQQGKQFAPAVAVVAVGTKLTFPNYDTVFHNVFSKSAGNAFDLGSIKAGEKPGNVVLTNPGHVEIFCNIHSKMRADVLVVPNTYFAKVRADGSFELPGVPVGSRKLVVWGPALKAVEQKVEVTASGAQVNFTPEASSAKPHLNKYGHPYGSYDE